MAEDDFVVFVVMELEFIYRYAEQAYFVNKYRDHWFRRTGKTINLFQAALPGGSADVNMPCNLVMRGRGEVIL